MRKKNSRLTAGLLALIMVFTLSGCSSSVYMDFLTEGWDGIVDGEVVWEKGSGKDASPNKEGEDTTGEDATGEEATDATGEEATEVVTDESGEAVTAKDGTVVTKKSPTSSKTNASGTNSATSSKGNGSTGGSSGSSSTGSTTQIEKKSYTATEALNYYKTSANKIKTMADGTVTCVLTKESKTNIPVAKELSGISASIVKAAFKEGTETNVRTCATKADITKSFCVEGQSYVCNLSVGDINSATVSYSGNNAIVTIKVKDDSTGTYDRSSKCVSTINPRDYVAGLPITPDCMCKGVVVKGTIDGNGRLTQLYYSMPTYFIDGDSEFACNLEQWWTISYK